MSDESNSTTHYTDLPEDWQAWLADCVMTQVPTEQLLHYLVEKGLEVETAQRLLEEIAAHPFVKAGHHIARQLKRRDWLLFIYQCIAKQSPYRKEIERVETLDRETFYKHYKAVNRPVIMTQQLKDWSVLKRWTPEYFKTAYGERTIQAEHLDKTTLKQTTKTLTMAEYIDAIASVDADTGWYMTIRNIPHNKETIDDLYSEVDRLPELLDPEGKDPNGYLLLGPKGTLTDLHFDLANAIYCQVYGRKHFKLVAPHDLPYVYPVKNFLSQVDLEHYDPEKWPLFENCQVYDFTLEAGEVLFLPVGWWHYVEGLDTSISVSFSNFYEQDGFRQFESMYGKSPLNLT